MPWQWEGWRGTSWEGTKLGQLTPIDPGDIPYHMASCSVYELRGDLAVGHHSETDWYHLVVSYHIVQCLIYIFKLLYITIIIFFIFYPMKLSLSQPMGLSLPTLSFTPLVGGWWLRGCVVLSCQLGVNHNNWMNLLNAHCIMSLSSSPVDTQAPKHMSGSLKMLLALRKAVSLTTHLWQSCNLGIPQILNWSHECIFSHLFIFYGNAT